MKKIFALLIAVAMIASMALYAFADGDVATSGDSNQDVQANVVDKNGDDLDDSDSDIERVYRVDIEWDSLIFVFKSEQTAAELIWDTETHSYSNLTGEWIDNSRSLTLTNHSNDTVGYAANFENGTKTGDVKLGVTSKLDGTDGTLATAVGTLVEDAPSVEYTVYVEGTPFVLTEFTVDTITVVLSK